MVHDGTLYVYTGHDEDHADFFWMQEWRVYSTKDMVNWTDHGSPLAIESFDWADDRAWASQCIERNGKFYWYVCLHSKLTNTMAIGVAVGDSPTGPFKDAIGRPLYEGSWDFIDPTVFVDDDGQAYLYWGNPNVYYAKLNADMVSLDGEVSKVEQTIESFGSPGPDKREKGKKYKDIYTEAPANPDTLSMLGPIAPLAGKWSVVAQAWRYILSVVCSRRSTRTHRLLDE